MLDPRLNHAVAVARCGSFIAAAQFVGVTQSAVTKGVADLERQLGYTLFHRTARGALLTEKGRDFVERATRLLHDARELLDGSSNKRDPYSDVIRIGVGPASLEWQLIEPIGAFQKRHPGILFEITGSTFERCVQQLRAGAIHVALGFDDAFREWADVRRIEVGQLRTSLFVRHGHPILDKGEITPAELSMYNLVSPSDSRPYGAIVHEMSQSRVGQGYGWIHTVDYFPIVQKIVSSSDAIGVVSLDRASMNSFRRKFVVLALDLFPPMAMCCAVRTRWDPPIAVRSFISTVTQTLAEQARASYEREA